MPCTTDDTLGLGGLFDIPGMITNAIAGFFGKLLDDLATPLKQLLADTLLATPDVTTNPVLAKAWRTSLGIAVGGYVLFVLAGGLTVMGYETVQSRYALKQIAPRLVIGIIAAATSWTLLGKAITLANALSHGVLAANTAGTGKGLLQQVLPSMTGLGGGHLHLLLLQLMFWMLVIGVVAGYLIRVAVVAVLAACAPLALACHALPQSEPLAKLWWRAVCGMLLIQLAQSFTLIVAVLLFFAPDNTGFLGLPNPGRITNLLAGLCLFWVLLKIPGWIAKVIFRTTPITLDGGSRLLRTARSVALMMLLRTALPARGAMRRTPAPVGRARHPAGGRRAAGPAGPGRGGPGGGRPGGGPGGAGGPRPGHPGTAAGGGRPPGGPAGGPRSAAPRSGGSSAPGSGGAAGFAGGAGPGGPQVTYAWGTPRRSGPPSPSSAHRTGGGSSGHTGRRNTAPGQQPTPPDGAQPGSRGGNRPTASSPPRPTPPPPSAASAPRPGAVRTALPPPPRRLALPPGRPVRLRLPLEPPRQPPTS